MAKTHVSCLYNNLNKITMLPESFRCVEESKVLLSVCSVGKVSHIHYFSLDCWSIPGFNC